MTKNREFTEEGAVSAATMAILGGLAVVALVATVWIGNTTSGLAADTAACVVSVGGKNAPDAACGVTASQGGGNAAVAANNRPLPPSWIHAFGSGTGKYDLAKLNLAERSLEIGLLRFNGLKLTVYQDSDAVLTRLQNAKTKDAALAALQELRIIVGNAESDGENNPNGVSLQSAATILNKLGHPAADATTKAQEAAFKGIIPLMNASSTIVNATQNYSTMTLAQLQATSVSIRSDLAVGRDSFPSAVSSLKEGLAIIDANR